MSWYILVILAFRRLRQKVWEVKGCLCYRGRPCIKHTRVSGVKRGKLWERTTGDVGETDLSV